MWRITAELVFWLHIVWIVVLSTGFVICWTRRYAKMRPFVFVGIGITWLGQIFFGGCPLTKLELFLLAKYDPRTVFRGSFIVHYIYAHFGIAIKEWYIDITLYVMIVLIVIVVVSRRGMKLT